MKKKCLTLIMILSFVCSMSVWAAFPMKAAASAMITQEDNIFIELDEEGTLTVSGTGATGDYLFWEPSDWSENDEIKKIVIEEGITRIGNRMFFDCVNLEEIVFPSTLTSLGEQVFAGCSSLTRVEIPDTLTEIEWCAFVDCYGLEEFVVSEEHPTFTVKEGVLFHKDMTTLIQYPCARKGAEYEVPEGVEKIEGYAFDQCSLETVHFPSTLKSIGDEAFHESINLKAIEIPEGVIKIGGGAFQECVNLELISLPSTLQFLRPLAFDNTAYYRNTDNWEKDILYIGSILVVAERWEGWNIISPSGDIEIKEGITLIGGDAFFGNDDITSIKFPSTLKHICEGAFYSCDGIIDIEFPERLETIDDLAFTACKELGNVKLGNHLTYIGYSVFDETPYVNNVNNYVDGVLYNNGNLLKSNNSVSDSVIKSDTRLIASQAFKANAQLKSVSIPESVEVICAGAFMDCDELKEVEIPATVQKIGDQAFGYNYYYDWNLEEEVITKYDDFRISGYPESEAHRYAVANEIPFNDLTGCQHNGEFEVVGKVDAGCLTDGYTGDKKCLECSEIFQYGEVIKCTGQHIEVGYDYVAPTCTESGWQFGCYCSVCGETILPREEIEAMGHQRSTLLEVAPTCTESGLTEGAECGICHTILEAQEIIPANGHYKYEKIPGTPATCTEPGFTDGYLCECGVTYIEQEVIPAGHIEETVIENKASIEYEGRIVTRCKKCEQIMAQETINQAFVSLSQDYFIYDGEEKTPDIIVKDSLGNDISSDNYRVIMPSGRTNVGMYSFGIEFKNYYEGYVVLIMKIHPRGTVIQNAWSSGNSIMITLQESTEQVTGYEIRYAVSENFENAETLTINRAYEVYRTLNNLKENTAYYLQVRTYYLTGGETYYSDWSETVEVKTYENIVPECREHVWAKETVDEAASTTKNGSKSQHCKNCDAKRNVKTIYKLETVKLGTTKYTYDGKIKNPKIVIKDSKGKVISSSNYTVTKAKGRTVVGKYTYKITFKNEYKGIKAKTLTFEIVPKKTSVKSITAAKKAFTVKWGKISSQTSGYEVMYSTSKNFTKDTRKTVTIKSAGTTSKKIAGLKAKKTYYVKVRTYKTVDGVKIYSDWSAVKSVKTK